MRSYCAYKQTNDGTKKHLKSQVSTLKSNQDQANIRILLKN